MKSATPPWLLGRPDGPINLRIQPRSLIVGGLLLLACLLAGLLALMVGTLPLSSGQVFAALFGQASGAADIIVNQWRLPRAMMALIFGAALGISGAIFQSLVRNPLGSPDIIGFNAGAYTGALVAITLFNGNYFEVASSALGGGLLSALAVYLLAYRQGIQGFRLIIVGIAIGAMLTAFNTWLTITASLEAAMTAAAWGAGSLNGLTWAKGLPSVIFIIIATVIAMLLSRRMPLLEMGDDAAGALGVPVEKTRLGLMAIGVILMAAVTAAAGPISFIALAAPQIAKRLLGTSSVTLTASALMGALLLIAADLCAQHLFLPNQLPVGVITISIGGLYLIWLLIRESGRS
ncbi:iron-enterobactin ABC transporter permease [Yersinia kristensenii]|uniref:iron-enterobactin ABC transporter permease n=1 Tax=Yersinia kristensenii TaxID=28152 RepID=UPI0003087517|nr:iron-enterobactin ABC transporter permease [Yersinia kristensenii]MBW5811725.1 iron-enterobactin ABC transporter permease [Yersinia kristensenii]MBW5817188.1 iron-enterobactin ABC transporter permease [Yersinia kristensenii]MBW5825185.1 iron-enterobactin ABC transporter permease [Yersinia kristensenii]MBW5828987.1 iron-enterobactin ABC transporter permease [Yersinia kristensenii]MBW5842882.1 iron-enterobactin ABC transporter permease [Yersinia kristensenii]